MRTVLLTFLLLGGAVFATASCTELPPDSGCYYNVIDGHLMPSAAGCPQQASSLWWTWWLYGRQPDPYESSTTTTLAPVGAVAPSAPAAPPVSTDPAPSMPEPTGSVSSTTTTSTTTTTTTTTIAAAPPG